MEKKTYSPPRVEEMEVASSFPINASAVSIPRGDRETDPDPEDPSPLWPTPSGPNIWAE